MVTLPQRPLGDTGLMTAPLSLGTVKLGRDRGVKYPTPVVIPDDDEAINLLETARALGINLLDTAPAYGNSEERLGKLLKQTSGEWLLCTKVGEEFDGTTSTHNFAPDYVRMSVERSLQRLATDHLDIVLIHSDGRDLEILKGGALDALLKLRAEGIITAVGMSHKSVEGARAALSDGANVMMATLNRDYLGDAGVIADAAAQGCGVLIKKALASGHGTSADLSFVAAQPGVHSIVVGTTNPQHLQENAAAVAEVM